VAGIKKLAGQTLWYGVPTILNRFLGYALSLLLFGIFKPEVTADITQVYAVIPFLNVLYTYGLETAYFRFAKETDKNLLYNSFSISIIVTSLLFSIILYTNAAFFSNLFQFGDSPQYTKWMAIIIALDTLAVIPMAKMRQEEQPKKFALINSASVIVFVFFVWYFLYFSRNASINKEKGFYELFYSPAIGIGYYMIANIFSSLTKVILSYKEILAIRWQFSWELIKKVLHYSYPFIIIGMAGMVNEMLSRIIYKPLLSDLSELELKKQLGIFGANFKIAVLVTIFVQIFKMAAEPFFFSISKNADSKKTYAKVMKFFVIACCFIFLGVSLFLQIWKYLIALKHPEYAEGIGIVPIIAMGYVCLGIYYNLSVWYKLTNQTFKGARITLEAMIVAIALNIILIKLFNALGYFGYFGAAWATFFTYFYLMVRCFTMGQKHYKIPYAWKKLVAYLVIVVLLFLLQKLLTTILSWVRSTDSPWHYHITGVLLLAAFAWFIALVERKELAKMPFVGKFFKPKLA
jgi:O-antigen/teichoic acid export membrane protein